MEAVRDFDSLLSKEQLAVVSQLTTPMKIQEFLDTVPYRPEDINLCPLSVFRDGKAHCFDGGLFAAAALRRLGYEPVIVDMVPENDDDHILALFRRNGYIGAVAKSNFVNLRYREPVYRSLRELIMSYFDVFYNVEGAKTLRGYTLPLKLAAYDAYNWMGSDSGAGKVADRLYSLHRIYILSDRMKSELELVDRRTYQAGMVGTNPDGLYKPGNSRH
jgi:hypothetical protein